uniref:UPAR/Ly6 domain-containing protein n=2 Tax=Nannospalax galili TaxID=1026970 RepID=A0A8C6W3H2_NANGA
MALLVLAIWASLVLASSLTTQATAQNLSCFQCFKVTHPTRCRPVQCRASERVCISNEVLLVSKTKSKLQISRRCAVYCPNSNSFFDWTPSAGMRARITRRCCLGNLCNTAPDTQEGFGALPGVLLMPVVLGLLCTLL